MLGEAMMEKPRAVILVLFALVLVFNSDPLMAQTADPGATTNQKLANEIVALRKRVEQLEKQNAELRGTIRDTKNKRSVEPTNMNGAVATADANVYAADLPRVQAWRCEGSGKRSTGIDSRGGITDTSYLVSRSCHPVHKTEWLVVGRLLRCSEAMGQLGAWH
jgi:cell division protein FtsB